MKIYHYHPKYKTYLGSSDADQSPLEPGVFLIPAHATEIEPPEYSSYEIPLFNGSSWEIIENCCGTYYLISTQEKVENNNPLEPPEGATKEKPPEIHEGYYLGWNNGWVFKQIEPSPKLTAEEKLLNLGLTVEDLKVLLGISS